jgi:glycosyltransferase involved in cell wall biosynthesis
MNPAPKIVVITPVKNEAWILDRFLAVTSQFADHIIVADQNSTDGSPDICRKYPKVDLILNDSPDYDEASRQLLLIQRSREVVSGQRILLALDADEVLAANAMETLSWQSMLSAKPGTVLFFEKPDLYITPYQCIRYDNPWPIGYVDDGAEHKPKAIHSIRVPLPDYARKLHLDEVKVLHYALSQQTRQASKMRLYSVIENVKGITSFALYRRRAYSASKNWVRQGRLETCPIEWFQKWEDVGIDMCSLQQDTYYWQDFEVLKYFKKYGVKRFWLDDIWDFDWEGCRKHAQALGMPDIPLGRIMPPPKLLTIILSYIDRAFKMVRGE